MTGTGDVFLHDGDERVQAFITCFLHCRQILDELGDAQDRGRQRGL